MPVKQNVIGASPISPAIITSILPLHLDVCDMSPVGVFLFIKLEVKWH
nr:MAG TPA: hypothetical protein [Caudoviricetes sp.]